MARRELTPEEQAEWNRLEGEENSRPTSQATETPQEISVASESTETVETNEAATSQQAATDPFQSLDPRVRDYITGLQSANEQLTNRLHRVEGYVGSFKQQLDALRKQPTPQGPTDKEVRQAVGDPSKFAALKSEYPEFAEAIEGYLTSVVSGLKPGEQIDLRELTQSIRTEVLSEVGPLVERAKEAAIVEARHEGWEITTQQPEFIGWVRRQAPEVQQLITSPKARDVVRLLDLYVEQNSQQQAQQRRLSSAAALSSRASVPVKGKSFEDMSFEEQWQFLEQQDQQAAQGARR